MMPVLEQQPVASEQGVEHLVAIGAIARPDGVVMRPSTTAMVSICT